MKKQFRLYIIPLYYAYSTGMMNNYPSETPKFESDKLEDVLNFIDESKKEDILYNFYHAYLIFDPYNDLFFCDVSFLGKV